MKPLISVIMSVKDGNLSDLKAAVSSILEQTLTDFEFLILNDGSTDNQIVAYLNTLPDEDKRIKIFHQENQGLTKSLNKLLQKANSLYCARMDGDDLSYPTRFEKQFNEITKDPDVALVTCWVLYLKNAKNIIHISKPPDSSQKLKEIIIKENPIAHSSVMFRTAFVRDSGGYDERLLAAQDYDLWCRLSEKHTVKVIPEILHEQRLNDVSITSTRIAEQEKGNWLSRKAAQYRRKGSIDGMADAMEEYKEKKKFYDIKFYQLAEDYKGTSAAMSGDPVRGWLHFFKAFFIKPSNPRAWIKLLYCPIYTLKYIVTNKNK